MKLPLFSAVVAAALLVLPATITATPVAKHHPKHARHVRCDQARQAIGFYVATTRDWEARHDASLSPASRAARSPGCAYVRWSAALWRTRSRTARDAYDRWLASMDDKWGCIHRHEGGWDAHNSGYGGGLQMDSGFQSTYGKEFLARYGPAGRWPVWAQYLAAERAFHGYHGYHGRGFTPWPNTARACGLL